MPRMIATDTPILTTVDDQPLTIDSTFRSNLRRVMRDKHVSQQELADRLTAIRGCIDKPVQRESIGQLLNGTHSPSLRWVEECSRALGCSIDDLL